MIIEYGADKKQYRIQDKMTISKSSTEVQYSDITVDFTNGTIEDLPFYLQEIRVIDDKNNNKLIFTGYLNEYKLPELRITDVTRDLEISLFTPRELATKKIVTITRTTTLKKAIDQILSPLYQDEFILKEANFSDITITLNLISKTVEEILNYLSNKYNLYWNINENKEIIINSIEYQFNQPSTLVINENNVETAINGLESITPTIENTDYANIINVKNARIFYDFSMEPKMRIKQNDRIEFENPIDIGFNTGKRLAGNLYTQGATKIVENLYIGYDVNGYAGITTEFNAGSPDGVKFNDVARDDTKGAKFVLTMDQTFKNLATGVTYKGEAPIILNYIRSETALRYASMKFINWFDINKQAGKLTPSGQIEKIFDAQSGWFTKEELINFIRNTYVNNDKETKVIKIKTTEKNNLKVGDKIEINVPFCLTKGIFVITSIQEDYEGEYAEFDYELRDTSLIDDYIDIFRGSGNVEEQESQTELEYVVEYAEEDKIKEIHEIELQTDKNSTLNFNLR